MARGHGGWAPYVPVAERRRTAEREVKTLRKRGHEVAPVHIEGRAIATTFWGKAWCDTLESYSHYDNRLPRGRTYVRNGSVIDLQIAPRTVDALVSGSRIYTVSIAIKALPQAHWRAICRDCTGGIDSLVELLQGRLSKGVMDRLCRQDKGLFPRPADIRFSCSCPDMASMCKHVAAVLYGVGARLDERPGLLFRLRAVDETDLVADLDQSLPVSTTPPAAGRVLEGEDLSALFGLDIATGTDAPEADGAGPAEAKPAAPARKSSRGGRRPARKGAAAGSAAAEPEPAPAPAPPATAGTAAPKKRASTARKTAGAAPAAETAGPRRSGPAVSKAGSAAAGSKTSKAPARSKKTQTKTELTPDGFVKWWK